MREILFVDDESNVLDGLRRMLRPMRRDWSMNFVDSGEAALEHISHEGCDVIVSDMRMPGMDGVELLGTVGQECPKAVRIALSGHAEMEMLLESVCAAHQYLAKPCDDETLKATIERACALRDLLSDERLTGLVTQLDSLPSLPTLYTEVTEELARSDSSLARAGEIIGKDVAMSAKVLQLVNSAFFGLRWPCRHSGPGGNRPRDGRLAWSGSQYQGLLRVRRSSQRARHRGTVETQLSYRRACSGHCQSRESEFENP